MSVTYSKMIFFKSFGIIERLKKNSETQKNRHDKNHEKQP